MLVVTLALVIINHIAVVHAHSPHDVIDALEISPSFKDDQTLFIAISDRIYRSKDSGYEWKELINGLDTKSLYTDIAIPSNFVENQTLFLATSGGGIFKGNDAGNSWVRINKGLGGFDVKKIKTHPQYENNPVILAALSDGGLYRSENNGEKWEEVISADTDITEIAFNANSNQLSAYAGDRAGGLYLSIDDGGTWKKIKQLKDTGAITVIAFPPGAAEDHFFIGTENQGVLEVSENGRTVTHVNIGAHDKTIESIAFSPGYEIDRTIFVSTWKEAVYVSNDKGKTWDKHSHGITTDPQADSVHYKSAHFRDIHVSNAYSEDGIVFVGSFDGLFKSIDGGKIYTPLETLPVSIIRRLALTTKEGSGLISAISTYGAGIYISDEDGKSWSVANKGGNVTRPGDIAFSPQYENDRTMVVATRGKFLRTQDNGNSWQITNLTPKSTWRNQAYKYLHKLKAPESWVNGLLTGADKSNPMATKIVMSPNYDSDSTLYFGTRWHGIYRSTDGGRTNKVILAEEESLPVSDLVISNGFASDRTLFAGFRASGVLKSTDGGDNWEANNEGLGFLDTWKTGIKHQTPQYDILLAISPNYTNDKSIFLGSSEGLYKSDNGGSTWIKIEVRGDKVQDYVIGLSISPDYEKDRTIIVSLRGKGLFISTDRGKTFSALGYKLLADNHSIELIEFSPNYFIDNTIFAASDEQVFVSKSKGVKWNRLPRPVRYENMRNVLRYKGQWKKINDKRHSAVSVSRSSTINDTVSLDFIGTGVTLLGPRFKDGGISAIEVDGIEVGMVDQYGKTDEYLSELFSIQNLKYQKHTIKVTVAGKKNKSSKGMAVAVDAFDIAPK